jgi:uncharacterized DUF497 family protein
MLYLEWDPLKALENRAKHGITFEAASAALEDPFRETHEDSIVEGEQRWRTVGMANDEVIVLVIHLEEDDGADIFARIISARKAQPQERRDYDKARAKNSGNPAQ